VKNLKLKLEIFNFLIQVYRRNILPSLWHKFMFETSRDILNWVLAASAGVLAFFICWSLYYFIAAAQRIFRLIKHVEQGVEKAETLIDLIKEKVSGSASYLMILGELLKRGMDFAKERGQRRYSADDKETPPRTKKKKK